jgi:hypothetical protein
MKPYSFSSLIIVMSKYYRGELKNNEKGVRHLERDKKPVTLVLVEEVTVELRVIYACEIPWSFHQALCEECRHMQCDAV